MRIDVFSVASGVSRLSGYGRSGMMTIISDQELMLTAIIIFALAVVVREILGRQAGFNWRRKRGE